MRGLLFSTIIATGAIAGSALALDVETNGYARFALQGNNIDGNEGTGFAKDWEFEFKGKETLDNGMTVFVDLEVDANGGADEIRTDDVTFGVSGGFGTVTVGIFNLGKVKAGQGLVPTAAGSAYGFGGLEAGDNQRNWDNGKTSLHHYSDRPSIAYTAPKISGSPLVLFTAQMMVTGQSNRCYSRKRSYQHRFCWCSVRSFCRRR